MNRLGHFRTNASTCLVHRGLWAGMPMREEAESLASDPVIWHGNGGHLLICFLMPPFANVLVSLCAGGGKHIGIGHGFSSMKCFALKFYNMTIEQYQHAFGYG